MDIDYEAVDVAQITPTVGDVALLTHTRTLNEAGDEVGTYDADTRPTDVECAAVITQAMQTVLSVLPFQFSAAAYPRVKQAVTLQAAIYVEFGFYREQAVAGSAAGYTAALSATIAGIQLIIGGGGAGTRVDSPVVRSTMTDYDPYYPAPPPKVIVEIPGD
ncbi:MAG TPA: hypothetical protein VGG82_07650 [Casimicrobiaceae bacterium]